MIKKAGNNNFTVLLDALSVSYTRKFARKMYEEHPHKNNMFGLSRLLSGYHIPNEGAILRNVDDVASIEPPFVALFANNLVVVGKITETEVFIFERGSEKKVPVDKFKQGCSGAVLVAEPDNKSIEPNFKENRRLECLRHFWGVTLATAIVISIILAAIQSGIYHHPGLLTVLTITMTGVFICYLLVKKALRFDSNAADIICSIFNKSSNCNNVLESKASKLFGIISWSEVGFGYFISGAILTLFFSNLTPYFALINICALPYTVWSVWYQKARAKQWCPLCLIVQVLFVLQFAANWIFGFIQTPAFQPMELLTVAVILIIPFLIITLLLPVLAENVQVEQATYHLNHFKMNENVFQSLLKEQPHYDTNLSLSKIIFGNPEADTLVTVVSNPHCNPCSMMHPKIDRLISVLGEKVCVQFLFLNFRREHIKDSGKFLIAAYLSKGGTAAKDIFRDWFKNDKDNAGQTYKKYNFDLMSDEVVLEQGKHAQWCTNNNIHGTPTLLINGYRLPEQYQIDDLINI